MPARRFRIEGRVQGVGFRWWTRSQARSLGVRGSVRNLSDGTVEVTAIGTEEVLDRLHARLQEGPPGSRVDRVDVSPGGEEAGAEGFEIVH